MERQDAAGHGVAGTAPESLLTGTKIAVVFVQKTAQAECYRVLDGILAHDVAKSLAVTAGALFPLLRLVVQLVQGCGHRALYVPDRVDQGLPVEDVPFALAQGVEILSYLHSRHVQVIE